jgi:hypothetical protein
MKRSREKRIPIKFSISTKFYCVNHHEQTKENKAHKCTEEGCNLVLLRRCELCLRPFARGNNNHICTSAKPSETDTFLQIFIVEGFWRDEGNDYGEMVKKQFHFRSDFKNNVNIQNFYFNNQASFETIIKSLDPVARCIICITGEGSENGVEYSLEKEIKFKNIIKIIKKNDNITEKCFLVHFGTCNLGKKIKKFEKKSSSWCLSGYIGEINWTSSISFENFLFGKCVEEDPITPKFLKDVWRDGKKMLQSGVEEKERPKFLCI